jgi:hypothetical protein
MSEKPISPLRQRMIEDMTVRNFVEKTRNDYIRQVKTFTSFLGRIRRQRRIFAASSCIRPGGQLSLRSLLVAGSKNLHKAQSRCAPARCAGAEPRGR